MNPRQKKALEDFEAFCFTWPAVFKGFCCENFNLVLFFYADIDVVLDAAVHVAVVGVVDVVLDVGVNVVVDDDVDRKEC